MEFKKYIITNINQDEQNLYVDFYFDGKPEIIRNEVLHYGKTTAYAVIDPETGEQLIDPQTKKGIVEFKYPFDMASEEELNKQLNCYGEEIATALGKDEQERVTVSDDILGLINK